MRFKKYFLELQFRFFIIFSHFTLSTFLFYNYKVEMFTCITEILGSSEITFYSFQLTNIFSMYLLMSIVFAAYFTYPLFLFQLNLFLSPALYKYENTILRNYSFRSIVVFYLGTWFTYYYTIPFCWNYFKDFEIEEVLNFEPEIEQFLTLYIKILLLSQLFFQNILFSAFFLVNYVPFFYKVSRKIVYFLFLLLSTLFTPPDFFSQIFLTLFLIILYECFVFFFLLMETYKKKRVNNGS